MTDDVDTRTLVALLRPSPAIAAALIALLGWAAYLTLTAADDMRGPYVVLLLCQSFVASTGYAARARRGHFDPLLAGRVSRRRFAIAHVAASTWVGMLGWCGVCLLDALTAGGRWPLGLTPRAVLAFLYVSAAAWALSVPFARYTAGVVWLVLVVGLAGSGRLFMLRSSYLIASDTWSGLRRAAGPALTFPALMVGEPASPPAIVVAAVAVCAMTALVLGIVFIARFDVALEDRE